MRKALVVGINDYPVSPLKACVNDADKMAERLSNNEDGSPNFDVRKACNIATKSELLSLIEELFSGDNDVALLYFAGHGHINEHGNGYLVTPDFKDKHDVGVPMSSLIEYASNSSCKNKVIILDCCHAGALGASPVLQKDTAAISLGVTMLTACRESETSEEKINGHGVFTNLLLAALDGGAANLNGSITPGGIYAYIDQALGSWQQRPMFKTNVNRFVSLRETAAQVSMSTLRKITEYFSKPSDVHELDPSYEFTNSPEVPHSCVKPYADEKKVQIFKDLQKYESVGLVKPDDEEHMYFAAMNSKACSLTPIGQHYWHLMKKQRL